MLTLLWLVAAVIGFVALAYVNAAGWLWILGIGATLIAALALHALPGLLIGVLAVLLFLLAIPLNWPWLRRMLVSDGVLTAFRKALPPMSPTERDAIEAGTVWWDGELFSGRPSWEKLLGLPPPRLSDRGAAFSRPRLRTAVRDDQRLGDDACLP